MRPPFFWEADLDPSSRDAAPVLRFLLTPAAALYGAVVAGKIRTATPDRVTVPVVCVGNISMGGTGKTPVVQNILSRLGALGVRAASLSRGYGGREAGPLRIDEAAHTAKDVGDEPLMLAQTHEAWIARDRAAGARAMMQAGVEMIVMDDGHQNPSLHKDLSLIVVDAAAPFGNGFIFPKGPLREPVKDGLARADAILLAGDGAMPEPVAASGKPVSRFRLRPQSPVPAGPLLAFAGIGRPIKFFDALKSSGGDVRDGVSFDDHHPYSDADLRHLRGLAAHLNARLITTEKDFARLPARARDDILTFPVQAVFENADAVDGLLKALLEARRP